MGGFDMDTGSFYKVLLLGILIVASGSVGIVFIRKFVKRAMECRAYERWLKQVRSLEQVRELTPRQFECFVAELFQKMGYLTNLAPASKEGEVDIVALRGGKKHVIQCRKYNTRKVKRSEIRAFYGADMSSTEDRAGIFITTGRFTLSAEKFAENKPIELVDGARLLKYMQMVGIGDPLPPETAIPEKTVVSNR